MSAPSLQTRVLHHLRAGLPALCTASPGLSRGGCHLTIDGLVEDLTVPRQALAMAVSSLMGKGLVERRSNGTLRLTGAGERAATGGVEIAAVPDAPAGVGLSPLRDTLRQRAWTAMRMSRTFGVEDLLVAGASGEEKDPRGNLQRYCKGLCEAGVLRRLARFQQGLSCAGPVYRLVRDLGPIAPVLRSRSALRPGTPCIHDPNATEPAHA